MRQTSDILRDPLWQFVGALATFAAILISIAVYLKQRKRKSLSYEILSRTPLLSVEEEIQGKIGITYEGKPIQQIHLVLIKIINSGNVSILPADYERPISVNFDGESQILTAEINKTDPDSLKLSIKAEEQRIILDPTLLNERDSVVIKTLVSKLGKEITIDGRIVGVKDIKKTEDSTPTLVLMLAGLGFMVFSLGSFTYSFISDPNFSGTPPLLLITFTAFFVGYGLLFLGAFSTVKHRKRLRRFLKIYRAVLDE